jgi:hypothetical protein
VSLILFQVTASALGDKKRWRDLAASCALRGKTNTMKTKRFLSLQVLGLVSVLLASSSLAADYYAVVDNIGKKPRNAFMDVSVDTSTGTVIDVQFNVYDSQGFGLTEFLVRANLWGFASSAWAGNFFNFASGQPILIRARTPDYAPTAAAMLHIDSLGAATMVDVAPVRRNDGAFYGAGTNFGIALGTFRSASLLIANASGMDLAADVFKGTRGADGGGIFSNPRINVNAVWKVDLTQNEALSNLIVTATAPVIVQTVVDDGRAVQSFMVLPFR